MTRERFLWTTLVIVLMLALGSALHHLALWLVSHR
jgi:hypothetical protein